MQNTSTTEKSAHVGYKSIQWRNTTAETDFDAQEEAEQIQEIATKFKKTKEITPLKFSTIDSL